MHIHVVQDYRVVSEGVLVGASLLSSQRLAGADVGLGGNGKLTCSC
jgi:hypothetical protein